MPKDACVIYNPAAGRGKAKSLLEKVRGWADPQAELMPTAEPGHGIELAKAAAIAGYKKIIAAGGDGTVHEVANGILEAERPEVIFSIWPLGSSNDYAFALGLKKWFRSRGKGISLKTRNVDVGVVTGTGHRKYFVNCLGIGFNGMVALESRKIRRLRGLPLYALAFLRAMLWHFRKPDLTIRWPDREVKRSSLGLSVNLGPREGGFPITPSANLGDGLFNWVHVAEVARWQLIRYLPNLILGKLPKNHERIITGTCADLSVECAEPLCVHLDGEFFCVPGDGVKRIEIGMSVGKLLVETIE